MTKAADKKLRVKAINKKLKAKKVVTKIDSVILNATELEQRGFSLFAAREQAKASIVTINQELQQIFNELEKLKSLEKTDGK